MTHTTTRHRVQTSAVELTGIRHAVVDLAAGRPVIIIDTTTEDDSGYLVFAAQLATPQLMAFTVRHTSGFVCVALTGEDCDRLRLPSMTGVAQHNVSRPDFTVTVDAHDGMGTGISATDRARTVALLAHRDSTASSFTRPGHVVPLRTHSGGVLSRPGHAEAAVDLLALARLRLASVLGGLVSRREPARMASAAECTEFAHDHGLTAVSIAAVAAAMCELDGIVVRA